MCSASSDREYGNSGLTQNRETLVLGKGTSNVTAELLDGKRIASEIRAEIKTEVTKLKEARGITPLLLAILVGEDPASMVYVRNKERACAKAGIDSRIARVARVDNGG